MGSRVLTAILLMGWAVLSSMPASAQESVRVQVVPQEISIDAFFDGTRVLVKGEIPGDCEAVVRVVGHTSDLHLKKKGKVLGLLWMNLDTLSFDNVPNVYLLYTPQGFTETLGPEPAQAPAWQLTLASLQERIRISPEASEKKELFQQLLTLKQSEKLYATRENSVQYGASQEGKRSFEVQATLPSRLPPGSYTVEAFAIRNGDIAGQTTQPLDVRLDGLPRFLASLAYNHGALYGLLATLVAIFAGLVTGYVFGESEGGH